MLLGPKQTVIPWSNRPPDERVPGFWRAWAPVLVAAATLMTATGAQAAATDRIVRAFDTLLDLAQAVSYPICFLMITGGFLVLMTGNREKGLVMIRHEALGFLGIQLAPAIMSILMEVGKALRTGP